ncbi:hypothetical protein BV898_18598 [Hypsibius exemplaris]|uniref:Bulb-type lectin domain-containing protein n=1 Tax=Hypsibius exemplaris TaxID=2072580 RepID=A0A9X6RN62_HYPEX|nr:hypothetical protein BV898_18598 [Hypsibius exemplaris]
MLKVQLCINLILFCALVRTSQGKEKLCFSKSYFGQCDGDDETCVKSCKDDKLSGGKCGAFRSTKVCYCEGCHQGVTASQLLSGTALKREQSLLSPDKKTKLSMQMNGDLVVSIIGEDLTEKSVWSTGTSSLARPPVSVSLLQNGDLVMVNDEGETAWRLGTSGTKYAGASLWVRNGGLICLANEPDGDCLWKSVTVVTSTQSAVLIPGRSVGYTWSVGRLHVTDVAEFSYSNNQARDAILQQILGVWNTALGSANSGGLRIDFVSQILSGNGGFIVTYSITGTTGKLTVTPKQLVDLVHTSISASRVVGVKIPSPNKKNLAFV